MSTTTSSTASSEYGVKESPVCHDTSMQKDSMTTQELRTMMFDPVVVVVSPLPTASTPTSSATTTVVTDSSASSASCFQSKLLLRKESRQGRSGQRWGDDDQTIRLVTGCVPILRDGRILLVSSSRKPAWILPKGGWEQDEPMEESAIRETYEEAGCMGTLGTALSPVKYETKKSKKRSSDPQPKKQRVENPSSSSPPPDYSHVQMTLFCLYIRQVMDDWPEPGRLRRAVSIDEAIEIVRPEFQTVLREIKQKGLHRLPPPSNDEEETKRREVLTED